MIIIVGCCENNILAALSSAEAPVSKHQCKKKKREAGALETENGSAGNALLQITFCWPVLKYRPVQN